MSIFGTILGNATRDAEIKQAGQFNVVKFSIASNRKVKGVDQTTFVTCSWFGGKRAESFARYLTKGGKYLVVGELSQREYNGKTYLECDVDHVDFAGGKRDGGQRQESATEELPVGNGDSVNGDDFPF